MIWWRLKNDDVYRARRYLCTCVILLAIALMAPILSWNCFVVFKPVDEKLGTWFARSGALTTIYALLAVTLSQEFLKSLHRPGFLADKNSLDTLNLYSKKFSVLDKISFLLTFFGTLIWGYGDMVFN